jgi:general stress protein YciG
MNKKEHERGRVDRDDYQNYGSRFAHDESGRSASIEERRSGEVGTQEQERAQAEPLPGYEDEQRGWVSRDASYHEEGDRGGWEREREELDRTLTEEQARGYGLADGDDVDRSQGGERGFATMDEEKRREIAARGGRAAHGEGKQRRGFALLDPQRLREVSARGGRAAHASGHAHEFDSQEAQKAARGRWH